MSVGRTGRTRLLGPGWSSRVSQWMMRSQIKSIQRGVTAGLAASTINAVVMANSRLRLLGWQNNNDTQDLDFVLLTFTNNTTITPSATTAGGIVGVSFEVTEYQPGVIKSIQRATMGSNTTATITAVDVTKSEIDFLGNVTSDATLADFAHCSVRLTNSTTVTSSLAGGAGGITAGFQVVEWF